MKLSFAVTRFAIVLGSCHAFHSFMAREISRKTLPSPFFSEKGDASIDLEASRAKVKELEAEYWSQLCPAEKEAEEKIILGMDCIKTGAFDESVTAFDRALEIKGPKAYLWHRGIPLYYLGRFRESAEHFEKDALTYAVRFEDAPSLELIWAAAARAQLGEAPVNAAIAQGSQTSSLSGGNLNLGTEALSSVAATARSDAIRVQLEELEAKKRDAAVEEDYLEAQRLKEEVDQLRIAAEIAAEEAAKAAELAAEVTLVGLLEEYRESNPVLVACLDLFVAAWNAQDSDTAGQTDLDGSCGERAALARLQGLVEAAKSGPSSMTRRDPLGRAFLGHFFAGLFYDAVRKDPVAAAQHMACAAREAQVGADGPGILGFSKGGILESLAERIAGDSPEPSTDRAPWV